MRITLDVKDEVWEQSQDILNEEDLTLDLAFQLFLQKIVKRGSIKWMFDNVSNKENCINESKFFPMHAEKMILGRNSSMQQNQDNKMTKNKAIRLLQSEGYTIYSTSTFASKNSSANNFWANPNFDYLEDNWSLILNDWINHKLYLFNIPGGSIEEFELISRADKQGVIDLQIMFEDPTFTDNRSNYSFLKYKVAEMDY